MIAFIIFMLLISTIMVFSVTVHLRIRPRNAKRLKKRQSNLHDAIFSRQKRDDDYGPFLNGARALS